MATGVSSWSKTAASNATADSAVNWAEGQAPSTVNNSSRAEMASVAMYRDDISGSLTTGGTATAYTLTTNQSFASLTALDGHMLAFKLSATNGASPTLAVDGLTAKAIVYSTGVAVPTGAMVSGSVYRVTYSNSGNEFLLQDAFDAVAVIPSGIIAPYGGSSAPTGWLLCYGQAISRTTYAALFAAISTAHGVGDGSTTFNLPDLRGRAAYGKDDMGGSAASRITSAVVSVDGTALGAAGGAQAVTLARANLPNTSVSVTITDNGHTHDIGTQRALTVGDAGNQYGGTFLLKDGASGASDNDSDSATTGITAAFNLNGNVSQTDVNKLPPAIILNYIIKT